MYFSVSYTLATSFISLIPLLSLLLLLQFRIQKKHLTQPYNRKKDMNNVKNFNVEQYLKRRIILIQGRYRLITVLVKKEKELTMDI